MKKVQYLLSALCLTVGATSFSAYASSDALSSKEADFTRQNAIHITEDTISDSDGLVSGKVDAKAVVNSIKMQLDEIANQIKTEIEKASTGKNEDILLGSLLRTVENASIKADEVNAKFNRDQRSYYNRAMMMGEGLRQTAGSYGNKASEMAKDAYNSDTAKYMGDSARGAASGAASRASRIASDTYNMANDAYNSDTTKYMSDSARGAPSAASKMAKDAYNSDTAKYAGDSARGAASKAYNSMPDMGLSKRMPSFGWGKASTTGLE